MTSPSVVCVLFFHSEDGMEILLLYVKGLFFVGTKISLSLVIVFQLVVARKFAEAEQFGTPTVSLSTVSAGKRTTTAVSIVGEVTVRMHLVMQMQIEIAKLKVLEAEREGC